ncbi:MAG TPA: pyruvate carboxylase [Bryobacteraceae bacterium]|jgi:pyruvate carboxylase|nr:pyruvate carboxylase [Bryobacteraceae bacterium]
MKKLLALNRGEIAIRILRAANELHLRTVAVYSREDRLSLHRFKADEAYLIGQDKGPVEAYLDVEGIVALAAEKEVDAIHPGYGFLSENPALPRACERFGIVFIGPSASILEQLGDKTAARKLAQTAGVPVVPGTEDPVNPRDPGIHDIARRIGFPLIIKAAFGGGGRGMRVVNSPTEFESKLQEASQEAGAAFGNDAVFLERYIRRAKHIEIQILGDRYGNILHLYERDCSVQRRHQKVVEIAPALALPAKVRRELADAAVALARAANYYNAGTVEFLVDADTYQWFFIEVNPRVQVEHTVTEVVTGIDIVRAQIQVAQNLPLHGGEMGLPLQPDVPLHGTALQCRVTTEDPASNFVPDYGKLQTYRSPAGFGIRLDAASAYGGAVILPYYDSLLVKVTAWGPDFKQACDRMDRALREFRIRGVKTNIQFLENVVRHPAFVSGEMTTSFLDETPELFIFQPRRDRATKLLTYLADVIVNGNPEVANKPKPVVVRTPQAPVSALDAPPAGTRQLLDRVGPEEFARWTQAQTRLLLTDTTFRDAHQSLFATRLRTFDMLQIAGFVARELPQLFSIEMWGGATFDVSMRFLLEDPWKRLQELRASIPNICFQMLLRASNAVGYTAYPDNVVREFIREAAMQGIDIFRIFDSLNWMPNMQVAVEATLATGRVCEAAICYTGDILDPAREKYSLDYYVRLAKELKQMGTHILGIKDMAGLLKPYAAYKLVKTLREEVGLPIHLHTHDTSGINAATILKAAEAGVHAADGAISPMSGTTSQPNLNSIVAALAHTERDTGLNFEALNRASDYWEAVRTQYTPFDNAPKSGSADVYIHEMPGGQYTNLREQAEAMGLGARWPEIARMYADVNMAFGDIVKVTPSSKVVGDLAIFLVSRNLTVRDLENLPPDHDLTLPNSVVEMFMGSLGQPEGGWPPKLQQIILRGKKPDTQRPGVNLPPADLTVAAAKVAELTGAVASSTDLMSYLMYPDVFAKFASARTQYGDLDVLPTRPFFYGLEERSELTVDLEPGKTLIIRFLTVGEARPDGMRTVFFELNGQPREIEIRDKSIKEAAGARRKADPAKPGEVGAPIPGAVTVVQVKAEDAVKRGDRLLVMEAMKMQTTIYSPVAGTVKEVAARLGASVEAHDLLVVIE